MFRSSAGRHLSRLGVCDDDRMMAKTTITTDDLDGTSSAETVTFGYAGKAYSIDLSKKNRAALEKALRPYIAAATKVGRRSQGGTRRSARSASNSRRSGPSLADVRSWAHEQGMPVAERGRVAQEIIDAYEAAH